MILFDILLWILKWAGILLLVLLGLFLLVVLLVLFVPVRYRGRFRKTEEPADKMFGEGRISWLGPVLRVRIRYEEKKLSYRARLFGICVVNSEKPKKEKKKKKEETGPEMRAEASEENNAEEVKEASECREERMIEETPGPSEISEVQEVSESPEVSEASEESEAPEKSGKESFLTKIKRFFGKIGAFFAKLKNIGTNVKKQISLLWYKKGQVTAFLKDEVQKLAFGKTWSTVKKVLRHLAPQKIKGQVEFGTGDPESTGKALAVIAIFYARYGRYVRIVPEFMEKRLVAEVSFKGRIRFGTLTRLGLSLLRDKNIKGFRKNWKKLLKELKKKAE